MIKATIIMTAYIQERFQAHMTMLSIDCITKYTEPWDYELILMSDSEKYPVRDDYKTLKIDKYIKTEGKSYTQSMNLGAQEAQGDVLVFLQNDVFVTEGWLEDMLYYIERMGFEAVFPDQVPRTREYIKETYKLDMEDPEALKGGRDAGCLMITRDAFERTGGWNEELTLLCEADFYKRMDKVGVAWTDARKARINHIMAATNLHRMDTKPEEYDKMMKDDADKLNK